MAKWVCPVCGYVHEGNEPPSECPVCHVPGSQFNKVEGELTLASEHEFGVYAKTVKNNSEISDEDKKYIFEQLKANFDGECSEVGMYLCMARIAAREGYPEVALYREKAARDLVAGKSGIVRRVSVLAGIGEVRPGQAVTAGETLIRGQRVGLGGAEEELCARGDVMAETWTERIAVCPAIEERKEAAGAGYSRFALLFGKRRLNLYFGSRKTLDGYDKMLSEYTLGVPGLFSLPIRVVRERLIPCTHRAERCAEPEEMAERLRRDLVGGTEGQILQMDFSSGESGGLLIVTLRAHCIENIAEERAQTP